MRRGGKQKNLSNDFGKRNETNLTQEENMPIVLAPKNTPLKIVRISADDKLKKHLESLGITINGEITVLSNSGGSVVCIIKDGRIALDTELSTKIFVA